VLGTAYPITTTGECGWIDGVPLDCLADVDMVMNDYIDWGTDEEIEAGECNGETSLRSVITHELGKVLGLWHSCDEGETDCTPEEIETTMNWAAGACDTTQSSPNSDDAAGLTSLYGFGTLNATLAAPDGGRIGRAPFAVAGGVGPDGAIVLDATWEFGNGDQALGLAPSYVYEASGEFMPSLCVAGFEECPDFVGCQDLDPIIVCPVPLARIDAADEGGGVWHFGVPLEEASSACMLQADWTCTDDLGVVGGTASSQITTFTFPHDGAWTVDLSVTDPDGVTTDTLVVDVVGSEGSGCGDEGCGEGCGGGGAGGVLVGVVAARRRRRTAPAVLSH